MTKKNETLAKSKDIPTNKMRLMSRTHDQKPDEKWEKQKQAQNENREFRERETYGDLVERDLRLEVDVVSGSRERAFHCCYSLMPKHAPYHTTMSDLMDHWEILSLNFYSLSILRAFSSLFIYVFCLSLLSLPNSPI